ncbi:MAG: hypothetical protein OQL08_08415 [Gammaproteobacteria bacterium]|nr:hypothetical protein [Gammaproteobacteria bacterium]
MADEEQKSETTATTGEPKPVERSVNVTQKEAPKKRAPAKKAPAKKAPAKKSAPRKKAAATAAVATTATAAAPSAAAEKSKAAPAAPSHRYTPPAKGIWWQALLFIVIVVYLFSLMRDTAKGGQSEEEGTATQPISQETTAPVVAPANGTEEPQPMSDNGISAGTPAPDNLTVQPWITPDGTMNMPPMPPRPYGMPAHPYPPRGYGFYGPDDWYGPRHPMPYPPMPSN